MSEDPQIIWEKWRDPYGYDDMIDMEDVLQNEIEQDFLDNEINTDDSISTNSIIQNNFFKNKIPFMITPVGIIPYTENTAAGSIFNFWTGHTNFNISQKICDIIEHTDGIESLDVFTRYRFRIAVGKCFDDSFVMRKVNKNIFQFFLM